MDPRFLSVKLPHINWKDKLKAERYVQVYEPWSHIQFDEITKEQ